jgi:hypothetical protein
MEVGSDGLEIWIWGWAGGARARPSGFDAAYIRYNWVGHGTGTCIACGTVCRSRIPGGVMYCMCVYLDSQSTHSVLL